MSDNSSSKPLMWDCQTDHPDLCDSLREALREIKDPELGYDIIQLGLVRNVTITENNALIKMILTTPFCPYGPEMLEQTRLKAEETLKRETHMDLSFDPWDFSMMEGGAPPEWGLYG